jgi:hypothetical protein
MRLTKNINKTIIVSLKDGKIYQGKLKELCVSKDESLTIEPQWSGARQTDGTVVYHTSYPVNTLIKNQSTLLKLTDNISQTRLYC